MKSVYTRNISTTERWASTLIGAALAGVGYQRDNRLLSLAGFGLIGRGATGFCPVSAAIGRDTSANDTRVSLGGSRGVIVEASTTIYRPQQEVYSYWRELSNLSKFMDHLKEVRETDGRRSHWVATGPMGVPVEWDAEIINDVPTELISWRTVGDSDVASAGSVRFRPASGGNGTEVRVKLQYDPPAGKIGATVAWMLGEDPQQTIEEDLDRFKQILEGGEASLTASAPTERTRTGSGKRARRDREGQPSQVVTEPLTSR